jgi:hypothetical protein
MENSNTDLAEANFIKDLVNRCEEITDNLSTEINLDYDLLPEDYEQAVIEHCFDGNI